MMKLLHHLAMLSIPSGSSKCYSCSLSNSFLNGISKGHMLHPLGEPGKGLHHL